MAAVYQEGEIMSQEQTRAERRREYNSDRKYDKKQRGGTYRKKDKRKDKSEILEKFEEGTMVDLS